MLIDLYMKITRYQQADRTKNHQVEAQIARVADTVWTHMRGARVTQVRPRTDREVSAAQATERAQEIKEWMQANHDRRLHAHHTQASHKQPPRPPHIPGNVPLIQKWGELTWRKQ
jgi:hypothetical protein